MTYQAIVLCDSLSPNDVRLTTIQVTFPRFVLAEFNTHRVFSRNSASSRAIPVATRIEAVRKHPFVPEMFGKNQKGMQAVEVLRDVVAEEARDIWQQACQDALRHASALAVLGVHKQLANRILEPFCWHTVLVTATEWSNFWGLRCSEDAQPEIRLAAEVMRHIYDKSSPQQVSHGAWHLPLVPDLKELVAGAYSVDQIARISAARCARVSYLTHEGERDPVADLRLADRLQSSGHMSPFEHVARPKNLVLDDEERLTFGQLGNFRGWHQYRKDLPYENNYLEIVAARAAQHDNDIL